MMLARWDPFPELAHLASTVDELLRGFFNPPLSEGSGPTYFLPVDVQETKDGYTLQAALPGFKPEDVEVTFADGVLTIEAKRSQERSQEEARYLRREVYRGNWMRRIMLPGEVKADEIRADFENGILTIHVPVVPKAQPIRIKVGSGAEQKELVGATS